MGMKRPQTYQDWLNELNLTTKIDEMINAAIMASKLNPNVAQVRYDVALVLANMYQREISKSRGHAMVLKQIRKKYDDVSKALYKVNFGIVLQKVIESEPNFDPKATAISQGKTPPGYIKSVASIDDKGNTRSPLGFVRKPKAREDAEGNFHPGLGYLDDENSPGTSLGFL